MKVAPYFDVQGFAPRVGEDFSLAMTLASMNDIEVRSLWINDELVDSLQLMSILTNSKYGPRLQMKFLESDTVTLRVRYYSKVFDREGIAVYETFIRE